MQLKSVSVVAVLSIASLISSCASVETNHDEANVPCLQLTLLPPANSTVPTGELVLDYELRNDCGTEVAFCRPKGPGCKPAWTDGGGIRHGVLLGWPDPYVCPSERVAKLAPHEKLTGSVGVTVFSTPTGQLSFHCEYQSSGHGTYENLTVWVGRVRSNWVNLQVSANR